MDESKANQKKNKLKQVGTKKKYEDKGLKEEKIKKKIKLN